MAEQAAVSELQSETAGRDKVAWWERFNLGAAGPLLALVFLLVLGALLNPTFVSIENFENVLARSAFIGIIAIGATFVITGGGIDLSVGSMAAFAAATVIVVTNWLAPMMDPVLAIALGVGAGFVATTLAGAINGIVMTVFGLSSAAQWRPLFIFAGVWFLVMALPTALFLRELAPRRRSGGSVVVASLQRMAATARQATRYRELLRFLGVFFVFWTGVMAMIYFAAVIAEGFGWKGARLAWFLLPVTVAGGIGAQLFPYEGRLPAHAAWFGEDQGRYVVEADPELAEEIVERARLLALPARVVARVGGEALTLKEEAGLPLADLRAAHEGWLPGYMGGL